MRKWIVEDWQFTISVKCGFAEKCRLGLETGDTFRCEYALPAGFCPKTAAQLHTLCEIIRCGGSFLHRGSDKPCEIDFPCADGPVLFPLCAERTPPCA